MNFKLYASHSPWEKGAYASNPREGFYEGQDNEVSLDGCKFSAQFLRS